MQATNRAQSVTTKATTDKNTNDNKLKTHVVRRNIEDYLAQKALDRRLTEVIDEKLNLGW